VFLVSHLPQVILMVKGAWASLASLGGSFLHAL